MTNIVGTLGLQSSASPAALQQIQWAVAAGTSDNITAAYPTPNTALTDGLILGLRASAANATTTPQFAPDGLAATHITKLGGGALSIGDIPGALAELFLRYNSANSRWELLNPARAASAVSPPSGKTGAYTVLNADSGTSLSLGGAVSFAVTFTAIGDYSPNFRVRLFNSDTVGSGRGKKIVVPGYSNFYLYPGQSMDVVSDNGGAFRLVSKPGRYVCPSFTCYVDPTYGSDTNDGLAAGAGNAFATLQNALSFIKQSVDLAGLPGTVQLAVGTYNENIAISSQWTGHHVVNVTGNTSSPSSYFLTCPSAASPIINVDDRCCIIFNGVEFNKAASGAVGVRIGQFAIADFNNCLFGSFDGGVPILCTVKGRCNITGPITIDGNCVYFAQVTQGGGFEWGAVTVTMPTALSFTAFVQVVGSGSEMTCDSGLTFTGTGSGAGSGGLKYDVQVNGTLTKNTVTLPGGTAGTTATGGQAV